MVCGDGLWLHALHGGAAGVPDGDGNMFIVDEHAERLWLPQRHAPAIEAMLATASACRLIVRWLRADGGNRLELRDLKRFVAGADVFSKQSDGTTVASQYAKLGITLKRARTRIGERLGGDPASLRRSGERSGAEAVHS
jgi:hypothetical protein